MPFITMFSVPGSLLCGVFSFLLLRRAARKTKQQALPESATTPRTDLAGFLVYAKVHLLVCLITTLLASAFLYPYAVSLIYDDAPGLKTAAFSLAVGPFLAFLLSNLLLVALIWKYGFRKRCSVIAILTYHIVLLVTILPEGGYMALLFIFQYLQEAMK